MAALAPWSVGALLLAMVIPAAGLNPLDNDAGSGGDAGDVPAMATPVGPGEYSGRLSAGVDVLDHYAVGASQGDVLRVRFQEPGYQVIVAVHEPSGAGYQPLFHDFGSGTVNSVYVPYDGAWLLRMLAPGPVTEVVYTFSLEIIRAGGVVHFPSTAPVSSWEVRFDEPTDFSAVAIPPGALNPAVSSGSLTVFEYSFEGRPGPWPRHIGILGSWSSLGDVVATPVGGVDPGVEVLSINGHDALCCSAIGLSARQVTGWVRFVSFDTDSSTGARATLVADRPVSSAVHEGGASDIVAWTEANSASDVKLVAPGVAVVGARDLEVNVDRHFAGVFVVPDAQPQTWGWVVPPTGWYFEPDGTRHELLPGSFDVLLGPERGRWRFHLEPSVGVGLAAANTYLYGAFVPGLGVIPA